MTQQMSIWLGGGNCTRAFCQRELAQPGWKVGVSGAPEKQLDQLQPPTRTQRIRFFCVKETNRNIRIFGSHARSRLPTFVGLAFAGEGDGVWMMGERPHGSCGHKNDQ